MKTGLVCAAGTITQGIFTLELQMSMQSVIHWLGALGKLFVLCARSQKSRVESKRLTNHITAAPTLLLAFIYGAMTHAGIVNQL